MPFPNGGQNTTGSGMWNWVIDYPYTDAGDLFTVDDLAGGIMNDKRASNAIIDELIHMRELVLGMIFHERNVTLTNLTVLRK
jgi:hypothetical protein